MFLSVLQQLHIFKHSTFVAGMQIIHKHRKAFIVYLSKQ